MNQLLLLSLSSSSVPWLIQSSWEPKGRRKQRSSLRGSQEFQHCHVCPFFDDVWPVLALPYPLPSTFNIALRDDLAEAVMPYHVAILDITRGEEWFLSGHETSDLAPYIVVGFVFPVGDAEELPQASVFLPQPGGSKSHTQRWRWIWAAICRGLNLPWKLRFLFHILLSLAVAAPAIRMQSCSQIFGAGHFVYGNVSTAVAWTNHHYFGFLCAGLHSICSCSFSEFVGQVLQLIFTVHHMVNLETSLLWSLSPETGLWVLEWSFITTLV